MMFFYLTRIFKTGLTWVLFIDPLFSQKTNWCETNFEFVLQENVFVKEKNIKDKKF